MSQTYSCADAEQRALGIAQAHAAVTEGHLVVIPTDTLYGLGCDAFNNEAVTSLLATKRRGPDMPVPVLVGSWDTVKGLVANFDSLMKDMVEAFWPGALSLVVSQAPSLPWNLGNTAGTVMLRMPLHPVAIDLLRATGPMAVSSANISGQPPATTVAQAEEQLRSAVSVYLDGGPCPVGQPSTIIDISGDRPRMLREGALTRDKITEVLGISVESTS